MNTVAKNNLTFGKSIESGLEKVSGDHEFLVQSFSSVLESLGVSGAANLLRKRDFSDPDGMLEPQTIQAISFYFQ